MSRKIPDQVSLVETFVRIEVKIRRILSAFFWVIEFENSVEEIMSYLMRIIRKFDISFKQINSELSSNVSKIILKIVSQNFYFLKQLDL